MAKKNKPLPYILLALFLAIFVFIIVSHKQLTCLQESANSLSTDNSNCVLSASGNYGVDLANKAYYINYSYEKYVVDATLILKSYGGLRQIQIPRECIKDGKIQIMTNSNVTIYGGAAAYRYSYCFSNEWKLLHSEFINHGGNYYMGEVPCNDASWHDGNYVTGSSIKNSTCIVSYIYRTDGHTLYEDAMNWTLR